MITPEHNNANETGLFWHCIPRNTLAGGDKSAVTGVREAKDRPIVLLCINSAGIHKYKLLVISKSAQRHPQKGVKVMQVIYHSKDVPGSCRN